MARPEEGYPAATEIRWTVCATCNGDPRRHVSGIQDGCVYSHDFFCHTCDGRGAHTTRAYRWYEPIKILPPRTRRRPDPEQGRPQWQRDCDQIFWGKVSSLHWSPPSNAPSVDGLGKRSSVAKFQTDTWYRVF